MFDIFFFIIFSFFIFFSCSFIDFSVLLAYFSPIAFYIYITSYVIMGIGDEAEHDVWFSSSQLPFLVLLLHRCETCGSTDVRRGAQCGGHVSLIAELLSEEKLN